MAFRGMSSVDSTGVFAWSIEGLLHHGLYGCVLRVIVCATQSNAGVYL